MVPVLDFYYQWRPRLRDVINCFSQSSTWHLENRGDKKFASGLPTYRLPRTYDTPSYDFSGCRAFLIFLLSRVPPKPFCSALSSSTAVAVVLYNCRCSLRFYVFCQLEFYILTDFQFLDFSTANEKFAGTRDAHSPLLIMYIKFILTFFYTIYCY